MKYEDLINNGIAFREQTEPEKCLECFGQAFIVAPDSAAAFNNYGNTLRELGFPKRAVPFLEHACILDPSMSTAHFNLAVATLLAGDFHKGIRQYESRWGFEHLQGTKPQFTQPVWQGQDLTDKSILVIGEQGHGDVIHFSRFILALQKRNPKKIYLQVTPSLIELLKNSMPGVEIFDYDQYPGEFDYWSMIMSLPIGLDIDYSNLNSPLHYLSAPANSIKQWQQILGIKTKQRIGVCWSGRKHTWINRHKAVKFENIVNLIQRNPDHQWVNLQADATEEENNTLTELGVAQFPGAIQSWADTAGLIHNLDLVIGVDTAVSHLSSALGKPTWIMLNQYALDWRWLLERDDSPWYPTAKLFRQPVRGDWESVINKISQYLSWWSN